MKKFLFALVMLFTINMAIGQEQVFASSNQQKSYQSPVKASETALRILCGAMTLKGTPCKHRVQEQGLKCRVHGGTATAPSSIVKFQCQGTTKAGNRCRNKTATGYCHLHSR